MYFSEGFEDSIDTYFNFDDDHDKQRNSEGDSGWPNQVIINPPVGTQEIEDPISQHQAIHDQAAGPCSKKRKGTPLDDDEKKKRKRAADKKSRDKKREYYKGIEGEQQATKSKMKALESENESLNKEKNLMDQKLQISATQIEQLSSEIKRSNQTIGDLQQKLDAMHWNQEHVEKMEEELRQLKTKTNKLERTKESLTKKLQAEANNTMELQSKIDILNAKMRKQQQFVDLYTNGLNHNQELPMEQEQLGQEENGRLGFMGDGRRPITIGDMQEVKSMMMRMMAQIEQLYQKVDAPETPNPPSQSG
ncbi:switch-associated protein 70-like isoform X3 [Tripterygium wilfordii]|uniref:switch-associated protein 70-like isoform X3 n=1 Tax=Tripterygium wilfordii TaxID=458696 RepID=UPI0018F80883|nr:switch-associated protein 70-like isoform X3 [Tripterygium wilfordii]